MSSAIQQLKSKKVLVIVTQAILLKHSPMKTTLEDLSFVKGHESRILRVLSQFFGDRFRFQFHSDSVLITNIIGEVCMEVKYLYPPDSPGLNIHEIVVDCLYRPRMALNQ